MRLQHPGVAAAHTPSTGVEETTLAPRGGGLFCFPDSGLASTASALAPHLRVALTSGKTLLVAERGRTLRTLNILFSVRRESAGQQGRAKPGGRYLPSTL